MNISPAAPIKDLLIEDPSCDADWTIDLPSGVTANSLKRVEAGTKVGVFQFAPAQSSSQPVGQG